MNQPITNELFLQIVVRNSEEHACAHPIRVFGLPQYSRPYLVLDDLVSFLYNIDTSSSAGTSALIEQMKKLKSIPELQSWFEDLNHVRIDGKSLDLMTSDELVTFINALPCGVDRIDQYKVVLQLTSDAPQDEAHDEVDEAEEYEDDEVDDDDDDDDDEHQRSDAQSADQADATSIWLERNASLVCSSEKTRRLILLNDKLAAQICMNAINVTIKTANSSCPQAFKDGVVAYTSDLLREHTAKRDPNEE